MKTTKESSLLRDRARRWSAGLALLAALFFSISGVRAQQDGTTIHTLQLIERKQFDRGVTSVTLGRNMLQKYRIDVYKSVVFKKPSEALSREIQETLYKDRAQSQKIREQIDDGQISSAYYQIRKDRRLNSYVLFKRKNKTQTIIFLEGALTQEQLLNILEE